MRVPWARPFCVLLVVCLVPIVHANGDHGSEPETAEGDATTVDGGDTFATATVLDPLGLYQGSLTSGEQNDYYRFPVTVGDPINIELRGTLHGGNLPAPDNDERTAFRLLSPQGVLLDTANTNQGDTRIMVSAAPITGDYRFQVTREHSSFSGTYTFCFLRPPTEAHPCPDIGMRAQEIIYGGTLPGAETTRVLVVPPTHGDLGDPFGPTALDYLDATLSGIHEWVRVLHAFADDHPTYDYLKDIQVEVAVFNGTEPAMDPDIVITFAETGGTQFRGVAWTCADPPRCIVLSLYSMAPRSGQTLPDYPEYNDLEAVVKHEFAHVWGLGHTLTWTEDHGPDLMNSPAAFVYGNGAPIGDGGERTPKGCISTLNLYGMALLFRHIDGGSKMRGGWYTLPSDIPYTTYC